MSDENTEIETDVANSNGDSGDEGNSTTKILVPFPEFAYIYTVSLDGKIDVYDDVKDHIKQNEKQLGRTFENENKRLTRNEYATGKQPLFKKILDHDPKYNQADIHGCIEFAHERLDIDDLSYFVSPTFINKAVLACWEVNLKCKDNDTEVNLKKKNNINTEDKCSVTSLIEKRLAARGLKKCTPIIQQKGKQTKVDVTDLLITAKLKLFSTGSLSIRINVKPKNKNSCEFDPDDIINAIQYPNLSVCEQKPSIDSDGNIEISNYESKVHSQNSGILNVYCYELSGIIFNTFFRRLKHYEERQAISKSKGNTNTLKYLSITRLHEQASPIDRYRISSRHNRGLYTKKSAKAYVEGKINLSGISQRASYKPNPEDNETGFITYSGDLKKSDVNLLLARNYKSNKNLKSILKLIMLLANVTPNPPHINIDSKTDIVPDDKILPIDNYIINALYSKPNTFKIKEILKSCRLIISTFNESESMNNNYGYLWNAPLYVTPYIAVKFDDLPESCFEQEAGKKGMLRKEMVCSLVAMATQTQPFIDSLNIPDDTSKYLDTASLSRGKRDAIIMERRGLIAACNREPEGNNKSLDIPYNTMIFCIESCFATTKSVSSYNKELEEFVSWKVSNMLKGSSTNIIFKMASSPAVLLLAGITLLTLLAISIFSAVYGKMALITVMATIFALLLYMIGHQFITYIDLHKLRELINKARTLSPCEDFSSNIAPSLKSEISLKAAERANTYGLNSLIDTVHRRLENHGHFLKSSNESLNARITWLLSCTMLFMVCVNLLENTELRDDFNESISLAKTIFAALLDCISKLF